MNIVFESVPNDATHRYQHGGETSWYRETEDNFFVWRDGSWYASTQKSAKDLARVCLFGAVTILTQEVQLADDSEDDLTWLERRPVDLSEPAGGVKARGNDGTEDNNAMAQRLLVALKSELRSFDTGVLAEMVELADAEIVKRDAEVCGGEGYLNNHWFERGELPPVGAVCEYTIGANAPWYKCEIKYVVRGNGVVMKRIPCGTEQYCSLYSKQPVSFRPIRTERDELMDAIASQGFLSRDGGVCGQIADAILAAGFKRDGGAA